MDTNHPEIIKAVQNDRLVFFIGSGFSRELGFPDWKGLLKEIIQALLPTNPNYDLLIQTLDEGFLTEIEVLEKLQKHKKDVLEVLARTFQLHQANNSKLNKHRKLWKITKKFITTNYDKALETANQSSNKVVYDNEFYVAKLNVEDNYVFKLHGCIEDPSRCILFEENYKELYNGHSAAIETLKKIGSDKTIIFLGFSLADPFVKKQFDYINNVYKGMQNKHFIITTSGEDFETYVEPIKIDNWGEALDQLLDSLVVLKENVVQTSMTRLIDVLEPSTQIHKTKEIIVASDIRIAILIATPINKQFDYDFDKIASHFSNLNITIDFFHLSVEALNNLEGFDYLLLFTESVQGKIVVEDDNFKAKTQSIQELEREIFDDQIKGIFLFIDKEVEMDTTNISLPIVAQKFGNGKLSRFVFSTFKKAKASLLTEAVIINQDSLVLTKVESGSATINKKKSPLSKRIEPKNLKTFVGRGTDLEVLVRKILDIKQSILTIKGSGGIGKTTIIKKLAVEFSDRNYFVDGIFFIDCENIIDFQSFEYKVAMCFDLENSIDLMAYIKQDERKLSSLIIFDNFESLLYIEAEEIRKIKNLVSFICDYATVVITSREWIGLDYEERYELRFFTTDEAVELFLKYYQHTINEIDMRILRADILENLLNNNPLAIKIIAKNIPKTKNMFALKEDLESDFFNTTQSGFENIFIKEADSNIERSKSLYQSIYYSYSKLAPREKLAFEILCLFPDGMHMETYKKFFEDKEIRLDMNRISDREIKSLENKSLVEITQGLLRLQSIVGRFAEHQFSRRTFDEKESYYRRAFQYVHFLVNVIDKMSKTEAFLSVVGEISENNKENFFKCLEYLDKFEFDMERKLEIILYFPHFVRSIDQRDRFEKIIIRLREHFRSVENSELLINLILHVSKFLHYSGKFDDSLKGLVELIPMHKLNQLSNEVKTSGYIINWSLQSYLLIGNALEVLRYMINNNHYNEHVFTLSLYYLGLFKSFDDLRREKVNHFFRLESSYNRNILEIHTLEDYLCNIFEKDFTEVMQVNYIKAKMGYQTAENVMKLVVVNPYTQGLQNLMLAFLETNTDRAIHLYTEAIKNLDYVKYYQTEGIFFFSKFLKAINSMEYQKWFDRGYTSAKECEYRYLIHCFESLKTGEDEPYNEYKREFPDKLDIEGFIRKHSKKP
ncbi:SIR2 family protein [Tumebacillus algifaecis]|uniref:SIR2 family protein n=1 Tax=Tumebacillus algifaecis TaxID=1214604 RepID=UPI0012FD8068|nr:SIR2 family protein [Tumebacillus algifaecis]